MNKNKYRAKGVYWLLSEQRCLSLEESNWYKKNKQFNDIAYFASLFELKVYQTLIEMFGFNNVIRQYPLYILPKGRCYPKGKQWVIDFAIKSNHYHKRPLMLIEAKGYPTDSFLSNLALLEAVNPAVFRQLTIVFDRNIPSHRMITNLRKTNHQSDFGKVLLLDEFVERYTPLVTI